MSRSLKGLLIVQLAIVLASSVSNAAVFKYRDAAGGVTFVDHELTTQEMQARGLVRYDHEAPSPLPATPAVKSAGQAKVSMLTDRKGNVISSDIYIRGEIDQEMTAKVIALADHWKTQKFSIDSGGGNVEAAMVLGRYFRRKGAMLSVGNQTPDTLSTCASSCLFLLAGAPVRIVFVDEGDTRVGVHRPFTAKISSSATESTNDFRRQNDLIKNYFREMNVPESLLDLMNSVSPGSVKWLNQSEVEFFFPWTDPVFEDQRLSSNAAKRGISKQEMVRREQRAEKGCSAQWMKNDPELGKRMEEWMKCRDAFLDGLR